MLSMFFMGGVRGRENSVVCSAGTRLIRNGGLRKTELFEVLGLHEELFDDIKKGAMSIKPFFVECE